MECPVSLSDRFIEINDPFIGKELGKKSLFNRYYLVPNTLILSPGNREGQINSNGN